MGGTATVLHVIFSSNFKSRNNTLKKNLKLMLSKKISTNDNKPQSDTIVRNSLTALY